MAHAQILRSTISFQTLHEDSKKIFKFLFLGSYYMPLKSKKIFWNIPRSSLLHFIQLIKKMNICQVNYFSKNNITVYIRTLFCRIKLIYFINTIIMNFSAGNRRKLKRSPSAATLQLQFFQKVPYTLPKYRSDELNHKANTAIKEFSKEVYLLLCKF